MFDGSSHSFFIFSPHLFELVVFTFGEICYNILVWCKFKDIQLSGNMYVVTEGDFSWYIDYDNYTLTNFEILNPLIFLVPSDSLGNSKQKFNNSVCTSVIPLSLGKM